MTTRQLLLIIGVTTALALTIAWLVERTQVRAFVREFEPRLDRDWTQYIPEPERPDDEPPSPSAN
jgi:hypothetical protein